MRALLDINVLIALLDGGHEKHLVARHWLIQHASNGWSSSPITQNGCVRILSQPAYPNNVPTSMALTKLAAACASPPHEFWSDAVSLLDAETVRLDRIHGPRQLTDIYLLALAVHHEGRFVTFDGSIAANAVRRATARHVVVV